MSEINVNETTLLGAFQTLRKMPNVLNVGIGKKIKDGKSTNVPSIIVYVSKKIPESALAFTDIVPKTLAITADGITKNYTVDVVELSTDKFILGETSASKKDIATQRIIAGGVKK